MFPGDIRQYIQQIYVQENYDTHGNSTFKYFNATPCDTYVNLTDTRYEFLSGYNCPDIATNELY